MRTVPIPPGRATWARLIAACLVAAASLAFVACDEDEDPRGAWLPRYKGEPSGDDMAIQGVVRREGNCLVIGPADGPGSSIVVPASVTFDADANALKFKGKLYPLGQEIRFGGGMSNGAKLNWVNEPDPECIAGSYAVAGEPH